MLIVSIWKWLFAWEKQVGVPGSDVDEDRLTEWRLYQREFHVFGYPHHWG